VMKASNFSVMLAITLFCYPGPISPMSTVDLQVEVVSISESSHLTFLKPLPISITYVPRLSGLLSLPGVSTLLDAHWTSTRLYRYAIQSVALQRWAVHAGV